MTDLSEHSYTKCDQCHLFVDKNSAYEDDNTLAQYIHLSRGDEDDDALDCTHDAVPSNQTRTLAEWKQTGPPAMRARFEVDLYEGFLDLQENGLYDAYPVTALVEFAHQYPDEGLDAIGNRMGEFHQWLEYWERYGHGRIIMAARLDRLMPTV